MVYGDTQLKSYLCAAVIIYVLSLLLQYDSQRTYLG